MITNELDGSIALLMSSKNEKRAIYILSSQLSNADALDTTRTTSNTSLSSALRAIASLACISIEKKENSLELSKGNLNPNLNSIVFDYVDSGACLCFVDDAIESACKFLNQAAKNINELITGSAYVNMEKTKNGATIKESNANKKPKGFIGWMKVFSGGLRIIREAQGRKLDCSVVSTKGLRNGIRGDPHATNITKLHYEIPRRFVEVAFKETITMLLALREKAESTKIGEELKTLHQEAVSVLVQILQTNQISARTDYATLSRNRRNIYVPLLEACSWASLSDIDSKPSYLKKLNQTDGGRIGALEIIDAMLCHVQDIPERGLVSIIQFILRNAGVEDVVAYYSKHNASSLNDNCENVTQSKKGIRLLKQYIELLVEVNQNKDAQNEETEDTRKRLATALLSEAVLGFKSKIVMYSKCNRSFLIKAMRDGLNTSGEVETLLLTLAKLLKCGAGHGLLRGDSCHFNQVSLSLGVVHWISALTDAHMSTILKITLEGGLVIDRIQSAVRSTLAQSEFANEVKEMSDHTVAGLMSDEFSEIATKSSKARHSRSRATVIAPYTREKLAI